MNVLKISIVFNLVVRKVVSSEKSTFWDIDDIESDYNNRSERHKRSDPTSTLTDEDLENDYYTNRYKSNLTILIWPWAETQNSVAWKLPRAWQFSNVLENKVLPDHCGSCMLTNNKLHSKTANAAFINTRSLFMHLGHLGRKQFSSQEYSFKTYPYHYERPRSQYWFGWFQESASKGVEALPYLRSNVGEYAGFDSAFNLTMDVRRDSDVYFAHNGNVHQVYTNQLEIMNRYGVENEEILPHKTASQLAAAIISNCDKTPHAKWRMQVVDALVEAGLTLTGTGRCFKDHPSRRF